MLLKKQCLICGLRYAYTEKQIVMLNLKSVGYCAHYQQHMSEPSAGHSLVPLIQVELWKKIRKMHNT